MNSEILSIYSSAALQNAEELIAEARLLCEHNHFSRSYFLAVAAVEEIGKSFIAFDAQGRNLTDPSVVSKINRSFSDHASKIRAAFTGFLIAEPRKNAEIASKMIVTLQQGREPAMYTDLNQDSSVHIPKQAVRPRAAQDCVRFANDCLASAQRHFASATPIKRSTAEDQLFTMKPSQYSALTNLSDFWRYFIAKKEAGEMEFAEAAVSYRRDFLLKSLLFQPAETAP